MKMNSAETLMISDLLYQAGRLLEQTATSLDPNNFGDDEGCRALAVRAFAYKSSTTYIPSFDDDASVHEARLILAEAARLVRAYAETDTVEIWSFLGAAPVALAMLAYAERTRQAHACALAPIHDGEH